MARETNIPDSVVLVDGDNESYIDMNHSLSVRVWLSIVKKRLSFRLDESPMSQGIQKEMNKHG
jgi:hypothetical protein